MSARQSSRIRNPSRLLLEAQDSPTSTTDLPASLVTPSTPTPSGSGSGSGNGSASGTGNGGGGGGRKRGAGGGGSALAGSPLVNNANTTDGEDGEEAEETENTNTGTGRGKRRKTTTAVAAALLSSGELLAPSTPAPIASASASTSTPNQKGKASASASTSRKSTTTTTKGGRKSKSKAQQQAEAEAEAAQEGDENGLEGEGEEQEDEEDPNKLYCVCRKPAGDGGMIECEECNDWFHFKCLKLTDAQAGNIETYFCASCQGKSGGKLKTKLVRAGPASPSPVVDEKATGKKAANGKGKGKAAATTSKATPKSTSKAAAKAAKTKSKGKGKAKGDVNMEDGDASEKEEPPSSASSDEDSGDSAGSGDDAWAKKKGGKKVSMDAKYGKKDEPSDDEMTSEAGSSTVKGRKTTRGVKGAAKDNKNGKLKRKPSSSTVEPPTSKHRKLSTSALESEVMSGGDQGELNLRKYVIDKLIAQFEALFLSYHRTLQVEREEARARMAARKEGKAAEVDAEKDADVPDEEYLFNENSIKAEAASYLNKVEEELFQRNKEHSTTRNKVTVGIKYKTHFMVLQAGVNQELRRDYRDAIVTGAMTPSHLAATQANDLVSEQRLRENQRAQAESLHQMVRNDEPSQIKYTKKGLEDAETLQQIQKQVERQADAAAERQSEPDSDAIVHHEASEVPVPARRESLSSTAAPAVANTLVDDAMEADDEVIVEVGGPNPARTHVPRQPSFSLSAVMGGSSGPMMPTSMLNSTNDDNDEDGGFMGFTAEDVDMNGGGFDGYNARDEEASAPPAAEEEVVVPVVPTQEEKFFQLPVVWSGKILNPADPGNSPPTVEARQVAGRSYAPDSDFWKLLMPFDPINLAGRVPVVDSDKYLTASRLSPNKELIVVAYTPAEVEKKTAASQEDGRLFDTLLQFHVDKQRHAVSSPYSSKVPPPPGIPKEFYLVPVKPGERNNFEELLTDYTLPMDRSQNVLLGVFVLPRYSVPPPPAPAPPPPSQTPVDVSHLLASLQPSLFANFNQPNPSQNPGPSAIPSSWSGGLPGQIPGLTGNYSQQAPLGASNYASSPKTAALAASASHAYTNASQSPASVHSNPVSGGSSRNAPPVHPSRMNHFNAPQNGSQSNGRGGGRSPGSGGGYGHQRGNSRDGYGGGQSNGYGDRRY